MTLKTYQYIEGSYNHLQSTRPSALEIIPEIIKLVQPTSVIDLGCGIGVWLSVFQELGVENVTGVDGHWVDQKKIKIPKENFISADLNQTFSLKKEFDLAISVETAEHLSADSAETFVESLIKLAPVILFSAAVPFVPGNMHINCQWPSYWAKHFSNRGYVAVDVIRSKLWSNPRVMWCYSQGILLFVKKELLSSYPLLEAEKVESDLTQLDVIHPTYYLKIVKELNYEKTLRKNSSFLSKKNMFKKFKNFVRA